MNCLMGCMGPYPHSSFYPPRRSGITSALTIPPIDAACPLGMTSRKPPHEDSCHGLIDACADVYSVMRGTGYIFLLLVCLLVHGAMGHVPLDVTGGESPSDAALVERAEKSWVVYDSIPANGGVRYYRVEMRQGEMLRLSLFVPEKSGFTPELVVFSPGEAGDEVSFPKPTGYAAEVIPGEYPDEPEFEPFTPSVLYPLAEYTRTVDRPVILYIAVHESSVGGRFGLAIGYREEFSPLEWVLVPISVLGIRLWEGQPLWLILTPFVVVCCAAVLVLWREGVLRQIGWSVPALPGTAAGVLCLGSAGIQGTQIAMALLRTGWTPLALVSLPFLLIPALLGIAMIDASRNHARLRGRAFGTRMGAYGLLALIFWSGYIAGPLLAFLSAILSWLRR